MSNDQLGCKHGLVEGCHECAMRRLQAEYDAKCIDLDVAREEITRLTRRIETATPWVREGKPLDEEQMRALKLRWSTGPERYQADADALIATVIVRTRERDQTIIAAHRALRTSEAWSVVEIVRELIDAADVLLDRKDYDGHGWEGIDHARTAGRAWLAVLPAALQTMHTQARSPVPSVSIAEMSEAELRATITQQSDAIFALNVAVAKERQRAETSEGKHRHTLHVMEGMQEEIDRWTRRVRLVEGRARRAVSVLQGGEDTAMGETALAAAGAAKAARERFAELCETLAHEYGIEADKCGPEQDRARAHLSGHGCAFAHVADILRGKSSPKRPDPTRTPPAVIADCVVGCVRCAKPAALVGDRVPADGLCPWCNGCHPDRPGVARLFAQDVSAAPPQPKKEEA